MSDRRIRELERLAEYDTCAMAELLHVRRRTGVVLVGHVVQRNYPRKAVSCCEIRVAPAGVNVRGRGGRERATRIVGPAGTKNHVGHRSALGKALRQLRDEGVVVPFLDLWIEYMTFSRCASAGWARYAPPVGKSASPYDTTWFAFLTSAFGKQRLKELTP